MKETFQLQGEKESCDMKETERCTDDDLFQGS